MTKMTTKMTIFLSHLRSHGLSPSHAFLLIRMWVHLREDLHPLTVQASLTLLAFLAYLKEYPAAKSSTLHHRPCAVRTFLTSCVPSLEQYFDRLHQSGVISEDHLRALSKFEAASALEFLRTDVEMTLFDSRVMLTQLAQRFSTK